MGRGRQAADRRRRIEPPAAADDATVQAIAEAISIGRPERHAAGRRAPFAKSALLAAARIAAKCGVKAVRRNLPDANGARRGTARCRAHRLSRRDGVGAAEGDRHADPGGREGAGVLLRLSRKEELSRARKL